MELDELQKIWDTQNKEPIFTINMDGMHRVIKKKRNRTKFASNLNEWGLIMIAIVTASILFYRNADNWNFYSLLPGIVLLLTGVYVFIGRFKRKKMEKQFDQTILGDLDQAISNASFEIRRAKTFLWWYILPIASSSLLNMYTKGSSPAKWILVSLTFVLAHVVVNWSLNKAQVPGRKRLIKLREKITEEIQSE